MDKQLNLKPAFIERMQKLLEKNDFEKYIKSLDQDTQVSIRCNTLKISPEELKTRLETKGWKISQPWKSYPEVFVVEGKFVNEDEAEEIKRKLMDKGINVNIIKNIDDKIVNEKVNDINNISISKQREPDDGLGCEKGQILINLEPGELGRSLEHLLGYYYAQDLASMLPVLVLGPKPGELILDMCSSPGSKTTQIAASMGNKGSVIANEVSLGRIKILAANLERCGASNSVITKKDGIALCKRLGNAGFLFDKILIDAPCSGEGTLRSSPKTSIMWNPKAITSLSKLQKSMVESAIEILKPNGIIVYSTCTHTPEENEEVLDYILNKFKDSVKIEPIKLPVKCREGITEWQDKKYSSEVKKACRVYPHDTGTEGFFVAKLRKIK